MLRPYGLGLPSDSIAHRYGFDGTESDESVTMCRRYAALGIRSSFAVNTNYPEIYGGYFENRAVYALLDDSMRWAGLLPVIWECYLNTVDSLNPVEGIGQLQVDETYALANASQELLGILQIWRFHAGGGGRYYKDNVVFDIILPQRLMHRMVDDVERRCSLTKVRFTREASCEVAQ